MKKLLTKFILLWFLEKCPWDLSKSTPRVAIAWSCSPREFTSVIAVAIAAVFCNSRDNKPRCRLPPSWPCSNSCGLLLILRGPARTRFGLRSSVSPVPFRHRHLGELHRSSRTRQLLRSCPIVLRPQGLQAAKGAGVY